jgi:hypothetical protein
MENINLQEDAYRLGINFAGGKAGKMPKFGDSLVITDFPLMTVECEPHFIRGLSDQYMDVFSLAGTESLMLSCQEILMEKCALTKVKLRKAGKIFVLRYGGVRQLRRIYDYLYRDATICLARKKDKFYELIKDVPSWDDIVI